MSLNNIFDFLELKVSIDDETHKLGLDPLEAYVRKEKLDSVASALSIVLDKLTDTQKTVLRLLFEGYTTSEIGRKLNVSPSAVLQTQRRIPKIIESEAENNGKLKKALQVLFTELQPEPSKKEIGTKASMPQFTFLQRMKVCTGTRKAHRNDGNYFVPVTKCMIPEYLEECGLAGTICNWCTKCKRA